MAMPPPRIPAPHSWGSSTRYHSQPKPKYKPVPLGVVKKYRSRGDDNEGVPQLPREVLAQLDDSRKQLSPELEAKADAAMQLAMAELRRRHLNRKLKQLPPDPKQLAETEECDE